MYVGALAAMLGIEPDVIAQLLGEQYKGKDKLIKPNLDAFMSGLHTAARTSMSPPTCASSGATSWATASSSTATLPPRSARVWRCEGVRVVSDHPVVVARRRLPEVLPEAARGRRTGRNKFAIVQAEDELASIGIVIGAGWNGARGFTATSGPGVSLMTEFIGLAYFAEIPATIINVQRGGPFHRHADAHPAGGPHLLRVRLARRHQARDAVPAGPERVLRVRRPLRSTSPTACRRRSS